MAGTVGLFVPCYIDQLWPRAARAAVELVEALGFEIRIANAICCGQMFANDGNEFEAARVFGFWSREHAGFDHVVVLSASCAGFLRAKGARVLEFCEWIVTEAPERFPRPVRRVLALHSSCSALRGTRSAWAARALLTRVAGLELSEPEHASECCGFGGTFATSFSEVSIEMGRDKIRGFFGGDRPVEGVVSADCSCLLHLKGLAPEEKKFFHVSEVLLEALGA
ncbi:MAG: (Fe-S)-binding protein [Planctomycetota bacterium]